ncbi:glycoside hydrolase family 2 TIM barrel-domain containing protein [Bacteroidota bacterium]
MKTFYRFLVFYLIISLNLLYCQVIIKELSPDLKQGNDISDSPISSTRKIIPLNTNWIVYLEEFPEQKVTCNIPNSFEAVDELVYEQRFNISDNILENYKIILKCEGLSSSAEIYLNNVIITKIIDGMIPFSLEFKRELLTSHKQNILQLKIKNEIYSKNTIPLLQRYLFPKNSNGIIRNIYFELIPDINIKDLIINYQLSEDLKSVELNYNIFFDGFSTNQNFISVNKVFEIDIELFHPDSIGSPNRISKRLTSEDITNNSTVTEIKLDDPVLWSPINPKIYSTRIRISSDTSLIDDIIKEFSIYDLKFNNDTMLLNNKEFRLKGVTYIPSVPDRGILIERHQLKNDIEEIKKIGFNSIRFAKHIPNPYALQICDSIGIFALIELPVNSLPDLIADNKEVVFRLKNFTNKFINAYKTFSSAAFIGVGSSYLPNSNNHSLLIENISSTIKEHFNKITYASFVGTPTINYNNLDLYGVELYSKPIEDFEEEVEKAIHSIGNNKIFISEATYPNYLESSTGYLSSFSAEAQAKYFEDIIDFSANKKTPGFILNSMYEYCGDYKSLFTSYDKSSIYKIGILNHERNKNAITYKVLRNKLNNNERVIIPLGNKFDDSPLFIIFFGLGLAIAMGILINSKKKFREDATRALIRPYNFYADIRDHRIISGFHTNILMLILAGAHALLLTNLLYFLKNNILLEKILLSFGSYSVLNIFSYLTWYPLHAFFYLFFFTVSLIIILSISIKFASLFVKTKVLFSNIYYVVVWSFLPLAILLPVKLVLYKILSANVINIYIYMFLVLYAMWIIQRILKGVHIIFDVNRSAVYLYGFFIFLIFLSGFIFYFQLNRLTVYHIINSINQFNFM